MGYMEGPNESTGLNNLGIALDAAMAQKKINEAAQEADGSVVGSSNEILDLSEIKDADSLKQYEKSQAQEAQEKKKESELFKYFLDAFSVQVNDAKDKETFIESLEAAHTTLFQEAPDSEAAARATKFIEWINEELGPNGIVQEGKSTDEINEDIERIVEIVESQSPGAGAIYGAALKKFAFAQKPEPTPAASVEAEQNRAYIEGEKTKLTNLERGLLYNLARIDLRTPSAANDNYIKNIITSLETQRELLRGLNGTDAVSAQDIKNVDFALKQLNDGNYTPKELDGTILAPFITKHPDYYAEQKAANPNPEVSGQGVEDEASFKTFAAAFDESADSAKTKELFLESLKKKFTETFGSDDKSADAVRSKALVFSIVADIKKINELAKTKTESEIRSEIDVAAEVAGKKFPGPEYHFALLKFTDKGLAKKSTEPTPGPAPKENPKPENAPGAAEKGPTFNEFAGELLNVLETVQGKKDFGDALLKKYDNLFGKGNKSEAAQKAISFINTYIADVSRISDFAVEFGAKNDIEVNRMIHEAVEKAEKEFPGTAEFYDTVLSRFVDEARDNAMEQALSQADQIPPAAPKAPEAPPVIPPAPVAPFKFVASPLITTVEAEQAARKAVSDLPSSQERISYILDTYPQFANAWNKDAGRAAKLESENVSDEDAKEFVSAFEAYAVMPRVVAEYKKIAQEKLKSPLFNGVDISDDVIASLEEKIADSPLEIVRLAQQLEARKELEKGIPALETRLQQLGGLDAAEQKARALEVEIEKYQAAEEAGFFTPVKAYGMAAVYGIRDMWNKAWGITGHKEKATIFEDIPKLLKKKNQEYNSLLISSMNAAVLSEEGQRLKQVFEAAKLSGNVNLQSAAETQYDEYIAAQQRTEALRIFNERVDRDNEIADKLAVLQREDERADMVRMKAREEIIAKQKYDETVKVNLLDPRQVFGIFGQDRRTMGNPYRPEFRRQINVLKQQLAAARKMTDTIESNQAMKANAENIISQLQNNAFNALGVEQVLRNKAIAALDNVMRGDYGANLTAFAQVGEVAKGSMQTGEKDLANAAEEKLASFTEMQGNFAKSVRDAIERALVAPGTPSTGPISKLRSALIDPLKKNPEPKAVQAVGKIVGAILTDMRTKKAAEKDPVKQTEYSNKIIHLNAIQTEIAKLAKT